MIALALALAVAAPEPPPIPVPPPDGPAASPAPTRDDTVLAAVGLAAGIAGFVGAPFLASAATHDAAGAVVLALSAWPGVMAVVGGTGAVVVGVNLLATSAAVRGCEDPCGCGCFQMLGDALEAGAYLFIALGGAMALASPVFFAAMLVADKSVTGHDAAPAPALLGATAGAALGAAALVGSAALEMPDDDDGWWAGGLVVGSFGIGLAGATAGYVLLR